MKRLLLLLLFSSCVLLSHAQQSGTSRWTPHADSIFQHINRSLVSTGLLTNYGVALKDYAPFQGTSLSAANQLRGLAEWRLLYGAMQSSIFNGNATLLPLATANQRLAQAQDQQQAGGAISLAMLLVRYERFRDDAGSAGLVTVSNKQLYDNPNRPRSPYEQRTLVAISPVVATATTRSPQFLFSSQLRFTNAAPAITALEVDAGDGQGYRIASWDQPLTASYGADGSYTLHFRLTCADGSVLLSQAQLTVKQTAAPVANAYPSSPAPYVATYRSTDLFTARSYSSSGGNYVPYTQAATGTVTVAYAQGNTTNIIRKPLIVIEGYDPSAILKKMGVKGINNYDYNSFINYNVLGGISIAYNAQPGTNDKYIFNDQLSEVGQYDLIFLDFDNGTDYMQRNAYLVERLIQWVNDNKQPLPGQAAKEKNIVVGMSMGGLIARYALRDMEKRHDDPGIQGPDHDTRLYISHEAPHQGANVPLGFQNLIRSVSGLTIAGTVRADDVSPDLKGYTQLLNEPATQQLLIYQTTSAGSALHTSWLNEYNNQLGYPQRCRNVATSDGSECGRPQSFAPYAELVNIQGNGLLSSYYNDLLSTGFATLGFFVGAALSFPFGPLGFLVPYATGIILALGNYEGNVDFVVNALPDRQQRRIFHGRVNICKDILFGWFNTCLVDYADDTNSDASMLAYDSAPGGIYNIQQFAGSNIAKTITGNIPVPISRVSIVPTFCFVPTTSALDIGGGRTALGAQDLTASYANTNPPAAPLNTPFANFITEGRENQTHIQWTALNSRWAFQEMQGNPRNVDCLSFCQANPSIVGPNGVCASGATYSINNLPAGTQVSWSLNGPVPATYGSTTDPTFNIQFTGSGYGGSAILTATLISECGTSLAVSTRLTFGTPQYPTSEEFDRSDICNGVAHIRITNYDPGLTYTMRGYRATAINDRDGTFRLKAGGNQTNVSYTITASNNCGTITSDQTSVDFTCSNGYSYAAYPNPSNDAMTVQQQHSAAPQSQSQAAQPSAARTSSAQATVLAEVASFLPFTVRLYDAYGKLWLEQPALAPALQLRTAGLPAGSYILQVLVAGAVVQRVPLGIQH